MKTLTVVAGPVHAEKSTYAIKVANRHVRLKKYVPLIRPTQSVRKHERPGYLVTKNGLEYPSHEVTAAAGIEERFAGLQIYERVSILWIDEPMLWPDERHAFEVIQRIREQTDVLVTGLSATSELEAFGTTMPRLLAVADRIVLLRADCDGCGDYDVATRSHCRVAKEGQVLVGGEESYDALCPKCWNLKAKHAIEIAV